MKEELVKLVAQKTGLSEDIARTAVDTVLSYLKEKLPAPIATQIDAVMGMGSMGGLGDIGKNLGGLFS
jgi:nucleoid DNA-binding protein